MEPVLASGSLVPRGPKADGGLGLPDPPQNSGPSPPLGPAGSV